MSMQKIWKCPSDLLLGKKQREAGALRAEQGSWHCSGWGASEVCWKDHSLKRPDARMQGTSDVRVVLLSYMAHDADGSVCWRGSFWVSLCCLCAARGPRSVQGGTEGASSGGIQGCHCTPGPWTLLLQCSHSVFCVLTKVILFCIYECLHLWSSDIIADLLYKTLCDLLVKIAIWAISVWELLS